MVQGHRDGHGFLIRDDGGPDLYLSATEMRTVLHQDRVKARIVGHDRRGRPEGHITEIVARQPRPIIGRVLQEHGVWLVAPEDKRYGQDILVPKNALAHAKTGQVVSVELTEPPSLHSQPVGRVIEVLGEIDDPGMEIEIAVRKYGVPHEFSPEAMAETEALPDKVRPVDRRGRVDLTDVPLVTIDGEDSRDFDDAVYCEPAKVGRSNGFRLLVAIADVSNYVRPGHALDADAYERATSVYFPRRVIPMLPEKLSNGLCSLNPDVDRLCLVCDMLVTKKGDVHAYQFYPAVMRSHARLTYTEVAAILANTKGLEAQRRADLVNDLLHLYDVYQVLLKARVLRGAVDFDTTETKIVCDENGRIEKIIPYERNDAHKVIEEAMLAANVCAAEFIEHAKQPALYRVHEGPTPEKREILAAYLRAVGVPMVLSDDPSPAEFQRIAEATKDRTDATQVHTMLLRSMQQAIYTPINSGHFGLAYRAYTHFTSPIRRYPDLLVHRDIKAILADRKYVLDDRTEVSNLATPARKHGSAPRAPVPQAPKAPAPKGLEPWIVAGAHCSANERRADEASHDVEAWLKCSYMREHLGEVYSGTISGVTGFGIFVQLDTLYVDGLVHISELGGDYFRFDEARQELRGERTGIRYALGTRLNVQVSRVDLDGRRIDFRLVRPGHEEDADPAAGRAKSKTSKARGSGKTRGDAPVKARDTGLAAAAEQPGAENPHPSPIQQLKAAVKRATRRAIKAAKSHRPKRAR